MIRLYSNKKKSNVLTIADKIKTTETEWWMVYDTDTLEVIISPQQCSGETSSPYTMAIADSLEELEQHIQDNGLILSSEPFNFFPTDNIE